MAKEKKWGSVSRVISGILTVVLMWGSLTGCQKKTEEGSDTAYVDSQHEQVPTIAVEHITAAPSAKNVQVPVKIINNPGIAGATIEITFDDGLVLKDVTNGSVLTTMDFSKSESMSSPIKCSWDSVDGEVAKDGCLVMLTFDIPENAKATESYTIHVSYRYGDIYDNEWIDLEFKTAHGCITIT